MVSRPISQDKLDEVFQGGIIMELILFIYVLVAIVVTGHVLLTREKDVDAVAPATDAVAPAPATDAVAPAPATDAVAPAPATATDAVAPDLLPGEEEDKWEDLAEDWEFPVIGKNDHDDWKKLPAIMVGDCKYNRALRGCGRHGKGKQKGGKHINKKKFRRADTKAHLSILEELI